MSTPTRGCMGRQPRPQVMPTRKPHCEGLPPGVSWKRKARDRELRCPGAADDARSYLTSTLAPASSSFFGGFGVSLGNAFLDGLRSAVYQVLASFRPRPVSARTALMTLTPCWRRLPASTTVNSVCSSAAAGRPRPQRRRHAELIFHFLDQLGQFEHGHASDGVKDFSFVKCHFSEPRYWVMPGFGCRSVVQRIPERTGD